MGPFYAAAGAFVAALLALAVYHVAVARPALTRAHRLLLAHGGLLADVDGAARRALADRVAELEALAATDLSRAGFVRYDAFAGSGSGLSYALALLNRRGDGVVITSIYSREDTRTFGKPVAGYKPTVQASAEELQAIERARSSVS